MNQPAYQAKIGPQAYLDGEQYSDARHEYINGDVYAMSGAGEEHNVIAGNLFALLHAHLRGTPCRVFINDMKIQIKHQNDRRFYYPDLQVTCAQNDTARFFKEHPKLVVEVLSPATERADRAEKFDAYRQLESLEEYVLITQDTRRVEIYRRANGWNLELHRDSGGLRLASLDLTVTLAGIYEDLEMPK